MAVIVRSDDSSSLMILWTSSWSAFAILGIEFSSFEYFRTLFDAALPQILCLGQILRKLIAFGFQLSYMKRFTPLALTQIPSRQC
jgi:hypothetical protein